jgi:hypothetical protein
VACSVRHEEADFDAELESHIALDTEDRIRTGLTPAEARRQGPDPARRRRTREVGIRMALGAQRVNVVLLVISKAAFLLGLGLLTGLIASWFATRAIQSFLFSVGQHDRVTIVSVCALLAVCGMIAALIPARRAASIDPMQALRAE